MAYVVMAHVAMAYVVCSYGLCTYGLCSHDLYSCGLVCVHRSVCTSRVSRAYTHVYAHVKTHVRIEVGMHASLEHVHRHLKHAWSSSKKKDDEAWDIEGLAITM